MFDGTDLSLAYGSSFDSTGMGGSGGSGSGSGGGGGGGMQSSYSSSSYQNLPSSGSSSSMAEQPIPKSTASHQVAPDMPYHPPEEMYSKQTATPSHRNYNNTHNEGFWNRIVDKKWEVFKLFVMALIIMLGLSLHGVADYYLQKYIGSAFLSVKQEVVVRIAYPVAIILFIWIVKATA